MNVHRFVPVFISTVRKFGACCMWIWPEVESVPVEAEDEIGRKPIGTYLRGVFTGQSSLDTP